MRVITVVWLRARAGSPDLAALLETLLRTAAIVALAGWAAQALLAGLAALSAPELQPAVRPALDPTLHPMIALIAGGAVFASVALVGVRIAGDAPLRAGVDQILRRLTRRARPGPPA